MTLKASPLGNRGVRLGVPPADESKWTHSGRVPQRLAYSTRSGTPPGCESSVSFPRVLASLAHAVTERRRLQRLLNSRGQLLYHYLIFCQKGRTPCASFFLCCVNLCKLLIISVGVIPFTISIIVATMFNIVATKIIIVLTRIGMVVRKVMRSLFHAKAQRRGVFLSTDLTDETVFLPPRITSITGNFSLISLILLINRILRRGRGDF